MTPASKKQVYCVYNCRTNVKDDWYLNLYIEPELVTIRVLIPANQSTIDPTDTFEYSDLLSSKRAYEMCTYVQDDCQSVVFPDGNQYVIFYESQVDLYTIRCGGGWHSHSNLHLKMPASKRFLNGTLQLFLEDLSYGSLWDNTTNTKATEHYYTSNDRRMYRLDKVVSFSVLSDDDNFETCSKIIKVKNVDKLITNVSINKTYDINDLSVYHYDFATIFPDIWLNWTIEGPDTINAGESVQLTLKSFLAGESYPDNSSMKIECVDGYAPHKRVQMHDGVGTFKVTALGLEPGETMRVKINDYGFTSRVEKLLTVV